ncbi:hypothetical protein, partial [Lactobacillus delbrueckii]|uniref:hypothetical protein n=1 Tax=Lactobacillus delbrueckii TaxID=1584 RepID=UPI001CD8AA06
VDSQNLADVMVSVQFILAIGVFFFVSPANSFFAATTNISILVIFERSNQPFHSLYHGYSRQSCNILPCRFCFSYSALSFFLILQ